MAEERARVLIVAEPGSTHDGDPDRMRELITIAAAAGADVCKFQWVSDPARLCARRRAPDSLEAYCRIAFPERWHVELARACATAGIEYACTSYLPEDVRIVALFVERFKIASFEAQDLAFLRAHERYGRPILVSTGMASAKELQRLLARRRRQPLVRLLHCVSAYPVPIEELNLKAIHQYRLDGYSDHSACVYGGMLAVAAGAKILEVHFRLDDADPNNPDHRHSLTPAELREYVANVRFAEQAMGDGVKRLMPSERAMEKFRVR
mgnify:CR=1 FL=1